MYQQNSSSGCAKWFLVLMLLGSFALGFYSSNISNAPSFPQNDLGRTQERIIVYGAIIFGIALLLSLSIITAAKVIAYLRMSPRSYLSNDYDKREKFPKKSIVAIMRLRRINNIIVVVSLLLFLLLASLFFPLIANLISQTTQTIISIYIIVLTISHLSFEYRVALGLFGNNEREAREIIQFLIQESENIDFTDGGKAKKILSEEDIIEIRNLATKHKQVTS